MSLETIMQEARKLSDEDSRRLSAYLVSVRRSREEGYAEEMARRIDDKNPENWVSIEELDRRYGFQA